jgi:hypothetical protein
MRFRYGAIQRLRRLRLRSRGPPFLYSVLHRTWVAYGYAVIHPQCHICSKVRSAISASALMLVLSFLVALSFVMAANVRFYSMAKEVNQRLPKGAQINVWGWRHEREDVLRLHAEMYPESPKRWQMWALILSACVSGFRRLRHLLVLAT